MLKLKRHLPGQKYVYKKWYLRSGNGLKWLKYKYDRNKTHKEFTFVLYKAGNVARAVKYVKCNDDIIFYIQTAILFLKTFKCIQYLYLNKFQIFIPFCN